MIAADLRGKKSDELNKELASLLREQFNLRVQRGMGQPPKTHLFKRVRRDIARVKTILNEKGQSA